MANGHGGKRPGSGRPKGSVNKLTKALREKLVGTPDDPALALVEVMHEARKLDPPDWDLLRRAASDLMGHVHPRLSVQNIDLAMDNMPDISIRVEMPDGDADAAE